MRRIAHLSLARRKSPLQWSATRQSAYQYTYIGAIQEASALRLGVQSCVRMTHDFEARQSSSMISELRHKRPRKQAVRRKSPLQ